MKKFYDRTREMTELKELQRQAYNDYSRFVVLTGRRRVGKTSLVYKLMSETKEEAPGLYFFVGRKTETVLVRNRRNWPARSRNSLFAVMNCIMKDFLLMSREQSLMRRN